MVDLAKMRRKRDASVKEGKEQMAKKTKAKTKKRKGKKAGTRKTKPDDVEWDDIIGYEGNGETIGLPHEGVEYVSEKAALTWIEGSKYWVPMSQIADADGEALIVSEWWWDRADPVED